VPKLVGKSFTVHDRNLAYELLLLLHSFTCRLILKFVLTPWIPGSPESTLGPTPALGTALILKLQFRALLTDGVREVRFERVTKL
jgi:hypothetical protein